MSLKYKPEKKLTKEEIKNLEKEYLESVKRIEEKISITTKINPSTEKEKRIERALNDYAFFVETYFRHYIEDEDGKLTPPADFQLESANKIAEADNQQFFGAIVWSRGFGKSVNHSLMNPIWLTIRGKIKNVLLVSKTLADAVRLLLIIQSEFESNKLLKDDFAESTFKTIGNWTKQSFLVSKFNTMFTAIGRDMNPRGIRNGSARIDVIICDDADDDELTRSKQRVKDAWSWLMSSVVNTAGRNYRVIFIENHYAKNSLLTKFMQIPNVYVSKRNALVPDKDGNMVSGWNYYPTEFFHIKRESIGSIEFEKEFMNNPQAVDGQIFKENWIQYKQLDVKDLPEDNQFIVHYIDPSYTADYKCVVSLIYDPRYQNYFIADIFCRRCSVDEMYRAGIYATYEKYNKLNIAQHWYIEGSFGQAEILDQMEKVSQTFGYKVPISIDKLQKPNKHGRIEGTLSPIFERGMIYFNGDKETSTDFQTAVDMLLSYSKTAANDDFPDALESGIKKLERYIRSVDADSILYEEREGTVTWDREFDKPIMENPFKIPNHPMKDNYIEDTNNLGW